MEVVFKLKQFGFTQDEILYQLTANQVRHYYELAIKETEDLLKQQCIANRVAYHADEKQFDKFMKGSV